MQAPGGGWSGWLSWLWPPGGDAYGGGNPGGSTDLGGASSPATPTTHSAAPPLPPSRLHAAAGASPDEGLPLAASRGGSEVQGLLQRPPAVDSGASLDAGVGEGPRSGLATMQPPPPALPVSVPASTVELRPHGPLKPSSGPAHHTRHPSMPSLPFFSSSTSAGTASAGAASSQLPRLQQQGPLLPGGAVRRATGPGWLLGGMLGTVAGAAAAATRSRAGGAGGGGSVHGGESPDQGLSGGGQAAGVEGLGEGLAAVGQPPEFADEDDEELMGDTDLATALDEGLGAHGGLAGAGGSGGAGSSTAAAAGSGGSAGRMHLSMLDGGSHGSGPSAEVLRQQLQAGISAVVAAVTSEAAAAGDALGGGAEDDHGAAGGGGGGEGGSASDGGGRAQGLASAHDEGLGLGAAQERLALEAERVLAEVGGDGGGGGVGGLPPLPAWGGRQRSQSASGAAGRGAAAVAPAPAVWVGGGAAAVGGGAGGALVSLPGSDGLRARRAAAAEQAAARAAAGMMEINVDGHLLQVRVWEAALPLFCRGGRRAEVGQRWKDGTRETAPHTHPKQVPFPS